MSQNIDIPRATSKHHRSFKRDSDLFVNSLSKLSPTVKLTMEHYLQNLDRLDVASQAPPREYQNRRGHGSGPATIVVMGLRRSGKSSVKDVVFHRLPSSETLYLESTLTPTKDTIHSLMDFDIVDFPASYSTVNASDPALGSLRDYFGTLSTLIWVIDAQDEYLEAVDRLVSVIIGLFQEKPSVNFEVFIHKVDGISDDFRNDVTRDIRTRVIEDIADAGAHNALVHFHPTSVYDHSIFEAFSKVVQKLIPQLPTLESLLNSLCANCGMGKAYLFDKDSKLYVASDTSPGPIEMYEVCSDYIDMVFDINEFYGWERPQDVGSPSKEFGQATESLITMERKGNGALYLRQMNNNIVLVCIMGEASPGEKKALIDYNVGVFHKALMQVFGK